MHIGSFACFHAISLERSRFSKIATLLFHALVALKLLVSLISRLVACSARIVVDRQTDRHTHRPSTVTLAAHARRGLMRLLLAHRACASFVTAPTRIALSDRLDLASYRACDEGHLVSSCLCSAPHQQLVRATIGALALGCPPLGNSRTRSYHAMSKGPLHAPVNDHVMLT